MNETRGIVGENDLHAYVDGLLDEGRRAEVEAWLALHPQEAERVASWSMQNERIREAFSADFASSSEDRRMIEPRRPGFLTHLLRSAAAAAAALLVFAAGYGTGRLVTQDAPPTMTAATAGLANEARSAFLIYASEVRHPVEVGADQQEHLAAWLGKRLDYHLRLPDLSSLGYSLVGGRLVPVGGRPGALLMYQNGGGQRLTMMIGRNEDNRETSFRLDTDDPVRTFYWIDGPIGYAVTGEISADELRAVADECYRQMEDA
ncbi:anti-sigma factor [Rhizobium sp. ARZ01]|uniref:anti-sigma factor family protein n=1 Tax=Rhizobium sp. ARZ01 TaxID=2769313 RepID=UPI00177C0E37|nr:anti-sigma factor [Rhizobium sp. ARZ01]MBD9372837.1 anti-sigma factor [Rhizobium sp. ARZ01]